MNKIKLLDCTLRDGGYINNWMFGESILLSLFNKIVLSGVDIIEGGYLSTKDSGSPDSSRYSSIDDTKRILRSEQALNQDLAVMVNFGEFPLEKLSNADKHSPILRIAFHKKDVDAALDYINSAIDKGYRCFVQPMGALSYSDEEYIQLIRRVNQTNTEAFYIVDSFGVMEVKDFSRLCSLAENNLDRSKLLGYHAHNNLQQAYSNAKYMSEQNFEHDIIIDASIFGMGRGAGNLNIELFARYLNQVYGYNYKIEHFLEAFDECLKPIFMKNFWGYSLPFYLSSIHNCHPNYATFFSEKNTLSVKSMHELLQMIKEEDKISFSKEKAALYYSKYQSNWIDDAEALNKLKNDVCEREILILVPGKSIKTYCNIITEFIISVKPLIFGINTASDDYNYDYLFVTNEKRLTKEKPGNVGLYIKTSNLPRRYEESLFINYSSYLMDTELITDNPTLMLIKIFMTIGVEKVHLAGFDGFSANPNENYFTDSLSMGSSFETKIEKNRLIKDELEKIRRSITLDFLTPSIYLQ